MVRNHTEAVAMKDSIKLKFAVLEKADCMLTGYKDKETVSTVIDNLWGPNAPANALARNDKGQNANEESS